MIEVYTFIHGAERNDKEIFFPLSQHARARGHPVKLIGSRFRMEQRKHCFTLGVIKIRK